MDYRRLGRTGVSVSNLCLGTMMFGDWGTKDHDESIRIIHRALDAGINFVDTADVYSQGESEVIVGKALAGGRRDDVVLASKVHIPMGEERNQRGNSRRWITREVENSLQRLDTDWIDLYQIHRYDPDTDLDETLGALTDLVRAGKIRYLGHSTFPVSAIVEAQWTARDRGRERFVTEQPPYSILTRGIENDVLPTCARYGMGVISYSPLAGGWLSGRYRKDAEVQGPVSVARQRLVNRFDMSLAVNQRSSTTPNSSPNSSTTPASLSSSSRLPSASAATPRSPPPSSAPEPWTICNRSSPPPTRNCPQMFSTAST